MANSTARARSPSTYRILLDGQWKLEDFYTLPHAYGQVYSFQYSFTSGGPVRDEDRLKYAFQAFPWRGGYSAVSFYTLLSSQIPIRLRPNVVEIRYASPGWLDLALYADAAVSAGLIINNLVASFDKINALYSNIHKEASHRKLLRIDIEKHELELSHMQMAFVIDSSEKLAKMLGFNDIQTLSERTENPLATLKILLSYYRRLRLLAEYQRNGKASFPPATSVDDL